MKQEALRCRIDMQNMRVTIVEIEVIFPDNGTERTIKVKEIIQRVQNKRVITFLGKTITELMQNEYVSALNSHMKWDRLAR